MTKSEAYHASQVFLDYQEACRALESAEKRKAETWAAAYQSREYREMEFEGQEQRYLSAKARLAGMK